MEEWKRERVRKEGGKRGTKNGDEGRQEGRGRRGGKKEGKARGKKEREGMKRKRERGKAIQFAPYNVYTRYTHEYTTLPFRELSG